MSWNIECNFRVEVNTDPKRRCYNGCHAKSEIVTTPWELLVPNVSDEQIEKKLLFWRWLNAYAVSQRGESATKEFRAVPVTEVD